MSLSARRAWIEILCLLLMFCPFPVALRKESVDRNSTSIVSVTANVDVALRKESVDRNFLHDVSLNYKEVALRKESVDRNTSGSIQTDGEKMSLSARRAWIEMQIREVPS